MNRFIKLISVSILVMSFTSAAWFSANAAEIKFPGFTGNANTTVTSGFSVRTSALDCRLLEGWSYTPGVTYTSLAGEGTISGGALDGLSTAQGLAATVAARGITGTDATKLLKSIDSTGEGCGAPTSDTYGNTTDTLFSFGNDNANDGNLNFRQGDIFGATQKLYSEISGTTDTGMNVNLSFVGLIDPALDINAPAFKRLNPGAEDNFEQHFEILDAYITESYDVGDTFVDVTAGRFVTSWGESTFIPVGLNGLVTNSLDLPVLQSPSASIKEALMPTEQITITSGLADGSTIEGYVQFSHDRIGLGVSGSYFGSEVFGKGAKALDASGTYANELAVPSGCPWTMTGSATPNAMGASTGLGLACNATNIAAQSRHATNWANHDTTALVLTGLKAMDATSITLAGITGMTHEFGTDAAMGAAVNARSANNVQASGANTDAAGSVDAARLALVAQGYANLSAARYDKGATVEIFPAASGLFKDPNESGQYGLRWSKYLDNVGTGVDFGVYFANYHSKVPYIQMKMPNGVFAQDILGAYLLAAGDYAGTLDDAGLMGAGTDAAGTYQLAGTEELHKAVSNAMFSQGLCDAVLGGTLRTAFGYDGTNTRGFIDSVIQQANFSNVVDTAEAENEIVFNSDACRNTASSDSTSNAATTALIGTGSRLFAAVTPLNSMSYQGIFPEDNKVLGVSFNTNVSGTTIQGELAYRPNFPLATSAGDQINQIGDKTGANDALNMVAVAGLNSAASASLNAQIAAVEALTSGDYFDLISAFERSTLGNVQDENGNPISDLSAYNGAWYYSKPYVEYDTWSGTFGTTTSFTATHPVTAGLGADSSALVTELGFVAVPDLNDAANGYIARNGFNEGAGSGTTKCLGAFGGITAAQWAAAGAGALQPLYTGLSGSGASLTNIGSGVVDALFGNGGYCEDNPGADDLAATYRLLGTATYNNFNNTQWSLSPNIVVSHDFLGYAPSSLGGFTEDRFTLSLGATMTKGQLSVSASYVDYMDLGDDYNQGMADRDYFSMSVSQSF